MFAEIVCNEIQKIKLNLPTILKQIMENQEKNTGFRKYHIIYLVSIALLIGVIGFLSWKLKNQKVVYLKEIIKIRENTNDERARLTQDLNDMLDQYKFMKSNNSHLNKQLEEEKEKIQKMIQEIQGLKGTTAAKIKQYKDEVETLRKIMRHYVVQIDSLNTVNKGLKAENVKVKQDIEKEKTVNKELTEKKEELETKVNIASVIKAVNIVTDGLNKRGKAITKAKKVQKVKVCFILTENEIALTGTKDVYLRIARPDGLVLATSEQNLFKFGNEFIVFSAKRQVDYDGKNAELCIFWDNNQELIPGTYIVDLFTDGNLIGSSKFVLK
ncbi:MAG: hypothetical protein A2275_02585 [Bacteroidetes bacterium RIFOXYA12_FULL_35_11]|nr:MAG: hypothetical protein A2X01_06995 [Bacteroidetes bacterium GWF2_35_48]OFY82088.1 MAG: hypothetical protein A2275_02585 [Bacteroidetes bacterium RIFOXYA12_FULL_35_11]HBX53132.1 hypothetical protein [Bacteroidales bacterium]